MFKLVFLSSLVLINSQRLINVCFNTFEGFRKDVNIMFDDRLAFIPNALKLSIKTTENEYDSQIGILEEKSIFLTKADLPCDNNFIYQVPHSSRPIRAIKMAFSWGIEEMVIDGMEILIKQQFIESEHIISGQFGNLFMNIHLKNPSGLLLQPNTGSQISHIFKFNNNMRVLLRGELYCLSIFSTEYQKHLILPIFPKRYRSLSEFYILIVETKLQGYDFEARRRYLTKIFPCSFADIFDNELKLFIDPTTTGIRFQLFDPDKSQSFISIYDVTDGVKALQNMGSHFIIVGLQVELRVLTEEMVDKKLGMFLYRYTPEFRRCSVRLPEVVNNLLFSFILKIKVQDVVLGAIFQIVDMNTRALGVFKMKAGTRRELHLCD